MSIAKSESDFYSAPETSIPDQGSEVDTTRRNFLQIAGKTAAAAFLTVGAAVAGRTVVQFTKEKQAEFDEYMSVADKALLTAMNKWGNLQSAHHSPQDRKNAFDFMTRNLKDYQYYKAHADEVSHLPRDRTLPDWNGMTDEEIVAGTEISLTDYRQLRAEVYAGFTDPIGGSEPGTEIVKSLPEPTPTTETIAGN